MYKTPLYQCYGKAKLINFANWELPAWFSNAREEHVQTRTNASIFDVSHMGKIVVKGDRVGEKLDHLTPRKVSTLRLGKAAYTVFLNETGGIIDDLIAYRVAKDSFLLIVNAANRKKVVNWIRGNLPECELQDLTFDFALLAVQGPRVPEFIKLSIDLKLEKIKRFEVVELEKSFFVARTGYTGEDGFEIMCRADKAVSLWNSFIDLGVTPAGLAARDSLRIEAGYPLYGHEISENVSPLEANLEWLVDWKNNFVGREALKNRSVVKRLVGLVALEKSPIPRINYRLFGPDGEEVGCVTSGTFSPQTAKTIAMAYLSNEYKGNKVFMDIRKRRYEFGIVKIPFYKDGKFLI